MASLRLAHPSRAASLLRICKRSSRCRNKSSCTAIDIVDQSARQCSQLSAAAAAANFNFCQPILIIDNQQSSSSWAASLSRRSFHATSFYSQQSNENDTNNDTTTATTSGGSSIITHSPIANEEEEEGQTTTTTTQSTTQSTTQLGDSFTDVPGSTNTKQKKLAIIYTCKVCNTRSAKQFTEHSYKHGVVLVRCPGCQNLHLIADNLGWFEDEGDGDDIREDGQGWNVESVLAKAGENVKAVSGGDVLELTLEDVMGSTTTTTTTTTTTSSGKEE